jgi:hypothetical protein
MPSSAFTNASTSRGLALPRQMRLLRPRRHPSIVRLIDAAVDANAPPPVARLYTGYYYNHGSRNDMLRPRPPA